MNSAKAAFPSEREFIRWVQRRTTSAVPGLHLGIGDDAAVIKVQPGQELLLTSDLSIEGVHFTTRLHPPEAVGHRALARSLSDIAAMGGTPRYALISLAVSRRTSRRWIESFYSGLLALAKRYGVALVGGDTAQVRSSMSVDIVIVGEVRRGTALRRSGAQPEDQIFVSGTPGLAAWGLELLRSRRRHLNPLEIAALRAHLYPQPQCALGQSLRGVATSLMDLSDGLSLDLWRLCQASNVGATLFESQIPCPSLLGAAKALRHALHGGEDYLLLFTIPEAKTANLSSRLGGVQIHRIGRIQRGRGVRLMTSGGETLLLEPQGFDHFARR